MFCKFSQFCLLFAFTLIGQAQDTQLSEKVLLRELRVHVLDQAGEPVTGLKAEDFQIFENKQSQTMSGFEEINLNQTAASQQELNLTAANSAQTGSFRQSHQRQPRYQVVVIDSSFMSQRNFKRSIKALETFITKEMDEHTRLKIVQIDQNMRHLSAFTSDKNELRGRLEKAAYNGRLYLDLRNAERQILEAITKDLATGFDSYEYAANFQIQKKALIKENYFRTYYLNMLLLAKTLKPISGSKSVMLLTGGIFLENGGLYGDTFNMGKKLGRVFNEANATIYAFNIKPMATMAETSLNIANRTPLDNFNLNELQQRSLYGEDHENDPPSSLNTILENRSQLETGPSLAAESTGGLFAVSTSPKQFGVKIGEFYRKSGMYYRLGYTYLLSEKKRRAVKVEVKLKGAEEKGWNVVYGADFEPEVDYLDLKPEERALEFEARLLFNDNKRNDLAVKFGAFAFKGIDEGVRVSVAARLPVEAFPEGGFEVGFAAISEQGSVLDLTKSELLKGRGDNTYYLYDVLLSEQTPESLRFYVRNLSSGDYSFEVLPMPVLDLPSGSNPASPILISPVSKDVLIAFNHFREEKSDKDTARKKQDPLLIGKSVFMPYAQNQLPIDEFLSLFLTIEHPKKLEPKYMLEVELYSGGELLELKGFKSQMFAPRPTELQFFASFEAANLKPGSYRLEVRISHPKSGRRLKQQKTFFLVGR